MNVAWSCQSLEVENEASGAGSARSGPKWPSSGGRGILLLRSGASRGASARLATQALRGDPCLPHAVHPDGGSGCVMMEGPGAEADAVRLAHVVHWGTERKTRLHFPRAPVNRMSKPIPSIQKYMTTTPHSIGSEQTIAKASQLMTEYHVRHLPVLHGGQLLGILSDRDIKLIEAFPDVDPTKLAVSEAMTEQPYTVTPEAPLDEVVGTMAAKKYGAAVVVQNHKVVGIFTTVDACQALSDLLKTRLTH
jgi:acetoin utilization protein AcuB